MNGRDWAWVFGLLLAAAVCAADSIAFLRIHPEIQEKRLREAPPTQAQRLTVLRKQFADAGCAEAALQEQVVKGEDQPNLLCTLAGDNSNIILVVAHSDYEDSGQKSLPKWGAVEMLPLLAESLKSVALHDTFVFAALTGHQHKFAGAQAFLGQLSDEQRQHIIAVIDLEELGRTPAVYRIEYQRPKRERRYHGLTIGTSHKETSPGEALDDLLQISTHVLHLSEGPTPRSDLPLGDAEPFLDANLPVLVITSLTRWPLNMPPANAFNHPSGPVYATKETVDLAQYDNTYRLLCVDLLELDHLLHRQSAPAALMANNKQVEQEPTPPKMPSLPAVSTLPATPQAEAQSANEDASSPPIFRASTRLTQVDVVVRDSSGHPVTGLEISDYTALENGKERKIRSFEVHQPTTTAATLTKSGNGELPPHTYSNLPARAGETANIILFDLLNTPMQDQTVAKQQLIKLLRSLHTGAHVALFTLSDHLAMVHSFSGDPAQLVQAAEKITVTQPKLLMTTLDQQEESGRINYIGRMMGRSTGASDFALQHVGISQNDRDLNRARITLSALNELARAVSGYSGRKNLIWLSAGFPGSLTQAGSSPDEDDAHNTSYLLAQARVSVYPVDVRGVEVRGVDMGTSSTSADQAFVGNGGELANTIKGQRETAFNQSVLDRDLAAGTGGRAFYSNNDIGLAMQRVLEDGSTYYTLAYEPEGDFSKNEFRRIEVRTNHPGLQLSYRRGYWTTPKPVQAVYALAAAMQPGNPPATMLEVTAQVLPPDTMHKSVRVTYRIDAQGIEFSDTPDGKRHALIDCFVAAYDQKGRDAGHQVDTLEANVPVQSMQQFFRSGLPAEQEIELPRGSYTLRLGVMDRASQRVGSIEVPLVVNTAHK
jgi:VWFA-related protein